MEEKVEILNLIGKERYEIFTTTLKKINDLYEMDETWNDGGKRWDFEYKLRRGGKTLCAFYFRENTLGFMIIFGKDEREKVDKIKETLNNDVIKTYDEATTYHDGKWVMFSLDKNALTFGEDYYDSLITLLKIKRRPNKK